MIEKNAERTFLLVSCGEELEKDSLSKIEDILDKSECEDGVILKVLSNEMHLHLVEASLGLTDMEEVSDSIMHFQKIKFDRGSPLIEVLRRLHIPSHTQMVLRDKMKEDIMDYFKEANPDIVLFHFSEECFLKARAEKIIEEIKRGIGEENVYIL